MKKFNVIDAPNALLSRELLKGLLPVKERRKGRAIYLLIYIVFGLGLMALTPFGLALLGLPMIICLLGLAWLPITIFMIGYEQVLLLQNHQKTFIDYTSDFLNEDEQFLTILNGRALKFHTSSWLPDDFFIGSYFVFTSDRILIITFQASKIKSGGILYASKTDLHGLVSGIYSCDYIENGSCVFGGFINQLLLNIASTKIKVRAVGESDTYPWALENKGTRNGQLLKEIMARIHSRNHHYF